MTASHFAWDRDALRRVARLDLRARGLVDGFLAGRHRSQRRGASLEFAQHRAYVPGDDLRHLDWKVWGRADRLTVKQYEAETNLSAWLLVDASGSMDYGSGSEHKFERARQLAATLGYVLLRQGDAIGLAWLGGTAGSELLPRASKPHWRALLRALTLTQATGPTDLPARLAQFAERDGPRGLRVVVSDFLADADAVLAGFATLRRRGHDVLAIQTLHPDEIDLPFKGATRFESLESSDLLTCDPQTLRTEFRTLMADHLAKLRRGSAALGAEFRLVRTSDPLDAALGALLNGRAQR